MYQILTLNKISPIGLSHLTEEYLICENVETADGILVRSQDMHEMHFSQELKAIARAGAGVNNIPLDRCAQQGIVVFNTPGANANAVKELAICGMFLAARNIPSALSWAASLTEDISKAVEKGKAQFAGHEILGKTLGIVGLGAIGRQLAASAKALGMNVIGYDPYYVSRDGDILVYEDLNQMLGNCDFVSLHLPANDATKGMVNKHFLSSMKKDAVLLNFSRDKLVNDVDLLIALETGMISQYVTDFPNDNLVGREHVILLPHLGASTEEAEDNCATMAVESLRNFFENGNVVHSVNFPTVDLGPIEKGQRLSFIVKDMENPIDEISQMLKEGLVQVNHILGGTRQDGISYVLADIQDSTATSYLFSGDFGSKIISYRKIEK